MHKYELSYEYFGETIPRSGEVPERMEAYELLFKLLESEGLPVFILAKNITNSARYREYLERTRYRNVKVKWL